MREQAEAVQRMQDYIESHLDSAVTLKELAAAAGYSPWHAARLFREQVGIAPLEYLRARRLSRAALILRDTGGRVLDVALDNAFESHEGFTRAFAGRFGITPERYRKETPPLKLFMPRSARQRFLMKQNGGAMELDSVSTVFVQAVDKPARRLIVRWAKKAGGYWDYCEEMGCDVEGALISVKGALGEMMGLWIPANMRPAGAAEYAMGVEMPAEYTGPVPESMELIDLPPCKYLLLQGEPYKDEEMGRACAVLDKAAETYAPKRFGWTWADEDGPMYQLAPMPERGCILARPVKKL